MSGAEPAYRRSANVVFRKVLDEHLLVPIRGKLADMQQVFALNPVAAFVWNELDGAHSVAEIVASVVARFEVDAAAAEADVLKFIEALRVEGLIEGT